MHQKKDLNTIHYGVLQDLTPIKLCDPSEIDKIINILEKTALVISNYEDNVISIKKEYIESLIPDHKKKSSNDEMTSTSARLMDNEIVATLNEPIIENLGNNLKVSSSMELSNKYTISIENLLEEMVQDKNLNKMNESFLTIFTKDLLLQPIIANINGLEYFINIILSIFENGYGILKIEQEVVNRKIKDLSETTMNLYFDSYKLPLSSLSDNKNIYGYYEVKNVISLFDIENQFIQGICEILKRDIKMGESFSTLLLLDYDFKPSDIVNPSFKYKHKICNLISSPIYAYNELSDKQVNEIYKNSKFTINKYAEVYISTASKVIIADVNENFNLFSDFLKNKYDEKLDPDYICFIKKRALIQAVTPTIEVTIIDRFMKKEILETCINTKKINIEKLAYIKEKVYENQCFLNINICSKYDSMIKLTEFIIDRQTYGLNSKKIENIVEGFEDVIKIRDKIKKDRNSIYFSGIGIVLSIIISFIGIKDIMIFVSKSFKDLRYINTPEYLFRTTLITWIILTSLIFGGYTIYQKKYNKGMFKKTN